MTNIAPRYDKSSNTIRACKEKKEKKLITIIQTNLATILKTYYAAAFHIDNVMKEEIFFK